MRVRSFFVWRDGTSPSLRATSPFQGRLLGRGVCCLILVLLSISIQYKIERLQLFSHCKRSVLFIMFFYSAVSSATFRRRMPSSSCAAGQPIFTRRKPSPSAPNAVPEVNITPALWVISVSCSQVKP